MSTEPKRSLTTIPSLTILTDVRLPDGSETAPSLTFTADLDVGLFRIAANTLGVAVGGAGVSFGIASTQSEDFTFHNTSPGQQSLFRIASQDGDGTDIVGWSIHAVGGRISLVNTEELQILYLAATTEFVIRATQAGSGTQRAFSLQIGTTKRISMDATGLSFFGVTPVARPTAYTQTFATADKTHATPTVGADIGAFTDPPSAAEMALLRTFVNALKADHADLAQLVNAVIDDLQALGLLQ